MDQSTIKRPGELALVAIKNQSKAVQVFKKPIVPAVKKDRKIILTEESYMKVIFFFELLKVILNDVCEFQELGKIIQRDFFPDLEKLKAQNEYLDAIASNDVVRLRAIFTKYSSKRRPVFSKLIITLIIRHFIKFSNVL